MIILEGIVIENYRNLRFAKLDGLRDLNILIGPNNCGKTNLLELIASLVNMSASGRYLCADCEAFRSFKGNQLATISLPVAPNDFYLTMDPKQTSLRFVISLNRASIDRLVPNILTIQDKLVQEMRNKPIETVVNGVTKRIPLLQCVKDEIVMKNESTMLYGDHFSPFIHGDVIEEIRKALLYCPEGRLQTYRGKTLDQFISEKRFSGADFRKLIKLIGDLVDPTIHDHRYETLIKKVEDENFETSIVTQGSGVRSLICLMADILSRPEAKIVLIDEPELGLNPFVKQEFLKLLLRLSEEKQLLVTTQDPTFVNPVLWSDEHVSVYFYSLIDDKFVKIDLKQTKENPDAFAGYLPHTTSIRPLHLYVEGASDVYIFQIFLQKYLRRTYEYWLEVMNRIGVYHLGGDYWQHLLYTVPKQPYKCTVILDGDKLKLAKEVCNKHNSSMINASKFSVCNTIEEIGKAFEMQMHPIYCLKETCIERYLGLDPANLPQGYDKKRDGPKIAQSLRGIPKEVEEVFGAIFQDLREPLRIMSAKHRRV